MPQEISPEVRGTSQGGQGASDKKLRSSLDDIVDLLPPSTSPNPGLSLDDLLKALQDAVNAGLTEKAAKLLATITAFQEVNKRLIELMQQINKLAADSKDGSIDWSKGAGGVDGALKAANDAIDALNKLMMGDPPSGPPVMSHIDITTTGKVTASGVSNLLGILQQSINANSVQINMSVSALTDAQNELQQMYEILLSVTKALNSSMLTIERGIKGG